MRGNISRFLFDDDSAGDCDLFRARANLDADCSYANCDLAPDFSSDLYADGDADSLRPVDGGFLH